MPKTVEQLEREINELRAALKRGDYYIRHNAKHKTGGQDPVGAGGSITVSEADGTPSVASVTEIEFSNGSVTDNGDGTVSVSITGSGASAGESFVTLGATSGLSAERVLTEGAGIQISDGGANSTVTISARLREVHLSLGETFGYTV